MKFYKKHSFASLFLYFFFFLLRCSNVPGAEVKCTVSTDCSLGPRFTEDTFYKVNEYGKNFMVLAGANFWKE